MHRNRLLLTLAVLSVTAVQAVGQPPRGSGASGLLDRLRAFDGDGDGKVALDELPPRLRSMASRFDANQDESLDSSEMSRIAQETPRGDLGGGPDRSGPAIDKELIVTMAMSFDENQDGQLSKQELSRAVDEFISSGLFGGRGRGGPGGFGPPSSLGPPSGSGRPGGAGRPEGSGRPGGTEGLQRRSDQGTSQDQPSRPASN
ncbi:MAG: hypothetical protein KF752_02485 [Pirellulaceae bacterium]|nr:hypothetical protein [Pirellulaceae bacterium]